MGLLSNFGYNHRFADKGFRFDKNDLIFLGILLFGIFSKSFIIQKSNRLTEGSPVSFIQMNSLEDVFFILLMCLLILMISKINSSVSTAISVLIISIIICFILINVENFAQSVIKDNPYGRISLSSGFWIFFASGYFFYIKNSVFSYNPVKRILYFSCFFLPIAAVLISGAVDSISIMIEFYNNSARFFNEAVNHVSISFGSVFFAFAAGLPLAIFISNRKQLREKVFYLLGIVQTIPSIALFGFLMIPLAVIAGLFPVLENAGVSGIGWLPAFIALFLYSLLPVVINSFAGLNSIPYDILEASRGMGMSRFQILFRIKILLSLPVILNGLRVALVQSIGNTAVAALIGAGGFGVFIFQGLGQAAYDLILLGAIPTIIAALAADSLMQALINLAKNRINYDKV